MLDDLEEVDVIKIAIYNLLLYLYDYGLQEVHLGGLLRILGTDNETAQKYDDDIIELSDEFAQYVKSLTIPNSSGHTLH